MTDHAEYGAAIDDAEGAFPDTDVESDTDHPADSDHDDEALSAGTEVDDNRRGSARGANVKQIAKRSIEKYVELASASDADRRAAALVIGSPTRVEPAEIAVSVLAAPRANLRLLDRTDAIAEADDAFEAMATVMTLDPAEIRRTWDLLAELDVHSERWPGTGPAAKAIARAVHSQAEAVLAGTARIRTLVRK
ncbi:MAG: hypothetical protein V4737_10685 [Curtobacterium sp.]